MFKDRGIGLSIYLSLGEKFSGIIEYELLVECEKFTFDVIYLKPRGFFLVFVLRSFSRKIHCKKRKKFTSDSFGFSISDSLFDF